MCLQAQAQYQFDYALHSVMPVREEIALANLQPIPGVVEYAQGSPACYYKLHTIHSTKTGQDYQQWYRCCAPHVRLQEHITHMC